MSIHQLPDTLINQIAAGEGEPTRLRSDLTSLRALANARSRMRRAVFPGEIRMIEPGNLGELQ
ncbi:hypothetical protein [Thermomonas sp.]|uniref:hypothetical protein n=1 Tax=Thermomonas sp. TaxID=1971895 RepID=UPI00391AA8E4